MGSHGATARHLAGPPLRRLPAQRRSQERVKRMLDECALLLDEVGYDRLTTKEVARRAEVPIGTFYQFFTDKQSLVRALALRNLDSYLDRLASRLTAAGLSDWSEAVDLAIDEFVTMKRTVPGFGAVDFGDVRTTPGGPELPGTKRLLDAALENNVVVADRLRSLVVDLLGVPPSESLARAFVVAVEAADAVLKLAFRAHPDGDPDLIAEAKRLVRAYLVGYLA
ncbi:TetR family transcriptional regulator [Thermobispora bispora]|uniref:Transcriptional regulator, TetR family n=1 Tax=Thermobispora bispora (strain ATCC 19993 / DSM 43833 / CBS 139.67 / JCM 10125 / KCTC 9307 / NBRC 14880 / R51) TaxID=469371 RepID=D6Y645_THEBD|nr:TetR family transcriptional regulator [Thermobispora bispora]ADG89461.1 transcriptional regulator, TetR family [Thermobispora bispora DSM 43833]MBO2475348.1 TetR/AcrR family transcriptional regulator [Actinomycetales bacterium]MDI9579746.1 TetR family transcriptional regulator [Thermobispora sp.]QSI49096.1 TetR/AcrR family transcriptional regulator [Thermobispora bispora]